MPRLLPSPKACFCALCISFATLLAACDAREQEIADARGVINEYCIDCHNDVEVTGGLTLESEDLAAVPHSAEVWEKVIRKLRAGMMPPGDGPAVAPETRAMLAGWLESELDRAYALDPDPGRTVAFHRLNRNEYRNVIHDLLDLDIDVSDLLPSDDSSYGFDNVAGVLKVSPLLIERYLSAADMISRLAVGRPGPFENIDYFRVPDDMSQERRLPGMPFGTRGGISVDYVFPADAEYEFAAELTRDLNEQVPPFAEPQHLEISVDGERVTVFTLEAVPLAEPEEGEDEGSAIAQIRSRFKLSFADKKIRNEADKDWHVRVPVSAGQHRVTATFLATTAAMDETARLPFQRPYPAGVNIPETRKGAYLRGLEISGPYNVAGPGHSSASRERIMVCEPSAAALAADSGLGCAREILSTLARRAYRRSVNEHDLAPLLGFYEDGYADGGFDAGIQLALKRLLVSPDFLFRFERDPDGIPPDTPYRVDDIELASRLSFFLWSSIPDEELLAVAESGKLQDEAELGRQVRRMLADPRSDRFVENFAGQWLFLRNLDAIVPVQSIFPDFDDTLRQGLRRETELFVSSIVHEDRSALDLLRADYTFVNERVARHYGIPGVKGPHFRRIELGPDSPRRGLLGQGSILAVTSYPDRTSPVVRGKWILENLLGAPPPAPPPNVPGLVATDGSGSALSMRERLAAHRQNSVCSSCHSLMDPLGFALENFNAIGQWRTIGDADEKIDAVGELPDGTVFDGIDGLREALLSSDLFLTTMTEKLMTYATGRGVDYSDMPAVRAIVREAAADDYRFSSFVMGVVTSPPFMMRKSSGSNTEHSE